MLLKGIKSHGFGLPAGLKARVSDYWRAVQAEMAPPGFPAGTIAARNIDMQAIAWCPRVGVNVSERER